MVLMMMVVAAIIITISIIITMIMIMCHLNETPIISSHVHIWRRMVQMAQDKGMQMIMTCI